MGLILDTSVIVKAERRGHSVAEILAQIREKYGENEIGVSVVTIAELTHGIQRSKREAQRQRSQAFVDDVLATFTVYPVTVEIAQRVGVISGLAAEQRITLPFEDLLIGATALHLGFELSTHNARHFEGDSGSHLERAVEKLKCSALPRVSGSLTHVRQCPAVPTGSLSRTAHALPRERQEPRSRSRRLIPSVPALKPLAITPSTLQKA